MDAEGNQKQIFRDWLKPDIIPLQKPYTLGDPGSPTSMAPCSCEVIRKYSTEDYATVMGTGAGNMKYIF